MCSSLLVCAVLKTLHSVKHILKEEECRSVGKAWLWWEELAVTIAVKLPSVVHETLGVLKGDVSYWLAAESIKSKFCST